MHMWYQFCKFIDESISVCVLDVKRFCGILKFSSLLFTLKKLGGLLKVVIWTVINAPMHGDSLTNAGFIAFSP